MIAGLKNVECDGINHHETNTQSKVSSLSTQDKLALSSWGLPEKILQHYSGKGITHMFPWQLECLTVGRVLEGGNLVYSAPTSAGKTLVSEILIAQTILERGKKVLLILPFVSVVREKMFYFQNMFSLNGIKVEGYMGGHTPSAGFKQVNMAICTIEKANSIINKLLEEKNLNCLGLVVVDELHLLGDPYRGYLLELLLTKLKYMSLKLETNVQIVGMSATLPNLKVLANWLNADLHYTNYRPVPLSETLKCGNNLYDKKLNKVKEILPIQSDIPDCADNIGQLCLETIENGHSVLIFCPTKVWCENLADEIALFFKRHGCSKSAESENSPGWIIRNQINLGKVNEVIEHLKMTPVGADLDLQRTISCGVAFHHAGLTLDERDIIEGSFRNGSIRVLCATSTLSSGVNLPARRVIIRSPMAFGSVMDILTYRQMIGMHYGHKGRAGRMGVDSEGESIIICKPNEKNICQRLMTSNLKPIESCLGRGTLSSSLKRALLEIIASGIASTPGEVEDYANCTFLASSTKVKIENPIHSCITFLVENEFIRLQENGTIYAPTPLGLACLASSMPPDEGLSLFRELQRARRSFVLDTDLHIIYQVTPYSVSEQLSKLDWLHVVHIMESLPESMKRVGELVGVEEPFLVRIAKGSLNPNTSDNRIKLSIHRRFYTALALQDLINEIPLVEVAEKYQCNKGALQSLQQSAATYAGMVTEFTRKLGWGNVELIFSQFQERLQFGVQRDLCELMRLPLLNVVRARALYNGGYTNLIAIANANVSDLENKLMCSIPFQTKKEIHGETSFERNERNKLQTIWITGKADLSVRRAAELVIEQARNVIEIEMGVEGVKWRQDIQVFDASDNNGHSSIKDFGSNKNVINLNNSSIISYPKDQSAMGNETFKGKLPQKSTVVENASLENFCDNGAVMSSESNASTFEFRIPDRDLHVSISRIGTLSKSPTSMRPNSNQLTSTPVEVKTNGFQSKFLSMNKDCDISGVSYIPSELGSPINCVIKESTDHAKKNENDYFTTSFNVDVLNFSEAVNKNNSETLIDKVEESDSCSSCSDSSIAILEDKSGAHESCKSESGDMFEFQETELVAENTDVNGGSSQISEKKIVEVAVDLFSQSLTFDTQLQRMLDVDVSHSARKERSKLKRSSSFNSDDLGFVSDFSPPKLNQTNKKQTVTSAVKECSRLMKSNLVDFDLPKPLCTPVVENEEKNALNNSHSKILKRKICVSNSPDFINGSDDSWVEDEHVIKKARISGLVNISTKSGLSILGRCSKMSVPEDSDTEILPTPKCNKTFDVKNTCRSGSKSFECQKRSLLQSANLSDKGSFDQKSPLRAECTAAGKSKQIMITEKKTSSIGEKSNSLRMISRNLSNLSAKMCWDKISITDASAGKDSFQSFCEELKQQNIVGLAFGCRRVVRERKSSIGLKIMKKKIEIPKETAPTFQYKDMILEGVAIYFKGNNVFYIPLDWKNADASKKIDLIKEILVQKKSIRLFDAKEQIKLLHHFTSTFLEGSFQDPKVAHWLLSRSWREKGFSSIVVEQLPEATKLTSQLGPLLGFSGPGLYTNSSVLAKTRACLEAFLTFHVMERQLELMKGKSLLKLFLDVEMPVIVPVAEMELKGFYFDRNKLIETKKILDLVQSSLSDKAYSFSHYKFSLASTSAVSKLLYSDLKLGENMSFTTKKNQRPSTSKEALEELAVQTNHPLPDIIINWRKIQSIMSKVLSPLLQIDQDVSRLFPVTQMYTSTGRLSMYEPNLQNTPRNFNLNAGDDVDIRVRDIFQPSEGCTLLSVDYCQIELRFLAHLSEDENLIEDINNSSDVFVKIASQIYSIAENSVDEDLRQKAKRTCYGIIYGIGPRTLSHQLRVEESIALTLMEDFKNNYKGVSQFLENTLKECRKKGYVTSLFGRRRYLTYINDNNPAIKSEAERQAINTRIQGSAADLIKMALVRIRQKIKELNLINLSFNMLLHLHDELLFEVDHDHVETVATVIRETMENVIVLKVPTPVKVQAGPSWGQLRPYEF